MCTGECLFSLPNAKFRKICYGISLKAIASIRCCYICRIGAVLFVQVCIWAKIREINNK